MKQYLEIGKINNTHALKGEVKLEMWCDGIDYLRQLSEVYLDSRGEQKLTIEAVRPQKNIAILRFKEIDSVEKAEALKGSILYCNRDDAKLDEDSYYLADIIGCSIVDSDSDKVYGKVSDVMNYGSCDIYEMKGEDGKKTLIPATPDIIREIDTENGIIRIQPMKGLFDEN